MPSKNKTRGNNLEREVVNKFIGAGIIAQRAWGSNGEALGEHAEVDVLVELADADLKLQCKKRKKLPKFLGLTEHVDASVFKEDRGTCYIMLRLDDFIEKFLI